MNALEPRPGEKRLHPGWWTLILIAVIASAVVMSGLLYSGSFKSFVPVTLTSERSGLVMESGGKVMMNGVQVGRVTAVRGGQGLASLKLDIFPDQIRYIPANVGAQIRTTTAFGAKYVELLYPASPSPRRLAAGAVLKSRNVSTEVNTVFDNLVSLINTIDPAKLNAVLTAMAEGFGGQGERIGESITDANQVLLALNSRSNTIRTDWQALKGASDTYAAAAHDIVTVLDAASTTSETIKSNAKALDGLLLSAAGLGRKGTEVLAPNQQNLIEAINVLKPTTALLLKYEPEYTCTLQGAKWWLDNGGYSALGGNGRTDVVDSAILFGKEQYHFPDNLPIVAAKGGPGGKPGCGSLPDASKMFPVRSLVTNTGWGTGMDIRPNPGVSAQYCYADYAPVTRAIPAPPSIRQCLPGPAVGPVTAPGMPPYGASLYGPGGVPLWPGIPPAGTPPPVVVPGTPVPPGKIPPGAPAVLGEQPPAPPPPDLVRTPPSPSP